MNTEKQIVHSPFVLGDTPFGLLGQQIRERK
jgi:hypothetical protein